jgi:hypothetical protein
VERHLHAGAYYNTAAAKVYRGRPVQRKKPRAGLEVLRKHGVEVDEVMEKRLEESPTEGVSHFAGLSSAAHPNIE